MPDDTRTSVSSLSKGGMGRSLLLSGTILLLPLLLLFTETILEKQKEIHRLEEQLQRLDWVSPLYGALDRATQYRGLREISSHYPGHYDFAEEHLFRLEQEFKLKLSQLERLYSNLNADNDSPTELLHELQRIQLLWDMQKGEQFSFSGMSDLVSRINHLLSRLLPERTGLQRILLQDIPQLREALAQLRGTASGFLSRSAAVTPSAPEQRRNEPDLLLRRIERTLWDSESQFIRLRSSLEDDRNNLDQRTLSLLVELVGEIQEVRDLVEWELLDAAMITFSPDSFFEEGSEPIDLLHMLAMDILKKTQHTTTELITDKRKNISWMIALVSIALFVAILVAFRKTQRLIGGVQQAVRVLQRIGSGHLDQKIRWSSDQGEIGTLIRSIHDTQRKLRNSYDLLESERRFSDSLTSSMEDGVYALDKDRNLVFLNHAAEQMLGWRFEELKGQSIHDAVHAHQPEGKYIPGDQCPVYLSIASGTSYHADKDWFQHKSGHFIPIEISAAPLKSGNEIAGSVAVFRDISKRLELDQQLRTALEDAQQASQAKDEFLASMSHELRTPLTAIIGNCEFLEDQEEDADKLELVQSIESAGRRQLALVNDILDLSKIESGKFTIDEVPYDLNILVRDIKQMFAVRMRDAGLALKIDQQGEFTRHLIGDIHRIGQILINLIGNAIKFTEKGAISITLWCSEEQLHIKVSDSGIGMSEEVLGRLFQRFEQADSSISRRFGGSGLGLYISWNLAQLMGGSIHVESSEGEGSTFQLNLPLKLGKPITIDSSQPKKVRTLEAQLEGTILVAEDTPELQLLERRILESMGLRVITVSNGQEAVTLAEKLSFDLILMDMQMPEMDGIEATQAIRASGNQTPIIALTANVLQRHRDAFNEAGCSGFVSKPIDKQELQQVLMEHLSD